MMVQDNVPNVQRVYSTNLQMPTPIVWFPKLRLWTIIDVNHVYDEGASIIMFHVFLGTT